jgi:TP901 family phage tail tape measure protein
MLQKMLNIAVVLKAIDQMSGPMRQATNAVEQLDAAAGRTKGLKDLGESMQRFGAQALVAGAAAGAAIAIPLKAFADAETQISQAKLSFLTTAGLDRDFEKIEEVATRLGRALHLDDEELVTLASSLHRSGTTTHGLTAGVLDAAAAFHVLYKEIPIEELGQLLGTLRQSMKIQESDFAPMLDLIQRATFAFGLDPVDMQETLKKVLPIANALGVYGVRGAQGMFALVGAMYQVGLHGRQLSAALSSTMEALPDLESKLKHNPEILSLLNGKGINMTFFNKKGVFLGFENLIAQLEKLNVLSQSDRLNVLTQLFGPGAAGPLATLGERGVKGYREAINIMDRQAHLMERVNVLLASLGSIAEGVWNELHNLFENIGKAAAPLTAAIAGPLHSMIVWLTDFIGAHQTATTVILGFVGAFAVIATVVGAVAIALGTFILWMIAARNSVLLFRIAAALVRGSFFSMIGGIVSATRAVWGFTAALMMDPLTWIVIGIEVAIAAIIFGAYMLIKHWSQVAGFFQRVWASISSSFSAGIRWVRNLNLFSSGAKLISTLWEGMKSMASKPVELIRSVVQKVRDHLPFSPAKTGPLRDLDRIRLIETIAASMGPEPMVAAMRRAAALSIAAFGALTLAAPIIVGAQTPTLTRAAPVLARAQIPALALVAPAIARAQIPARAAANQAALSKSAIRGASVGGEGAIVFTYAPSIHLPEGTPKQTQAAAKRALDLDRPALEKFIVDTVRRANENDNRKKFTR